MSVLSFISSIFNIDKIVTAIDILVYTNKMTGGWFSTVIWELCLNMGILLYATSYQLSIIWLLHLNMNFWYIMWILFHHSFFVCFWNARECNFVVWNLRRENITWRRNFLCFREVTLLYYQQALLQTVFTQLHLELYRTRWKLSDDVHEDSPVTYNFKSVSLNQSSKHGNILLLPAKFLLWIRHT